MHLYTVSAVFGAVLLALPASADEGHGSRGHAVAPPQSGCCFTVEGQTAQVLIAPSAAAVRRIQAELAVGGYNPGPIDGALGPRTERALRGFQRDRGFIEGLVTVETLSALGIAVAHSSSGQAAGPQLAGARAAPTRRVVRRVAAQEAVQPAEPPDLPARLPNYISASTRHGVDALEWAGKTPR